MATTTITSEQAYRELALNEPEQHWELWDGVLVEKPLMSLMHNDVMSYLGAALINQLDPQAYRVHVNGSRTRLSERADYIPDVVVIPAHLVLPFMRDPRSLDAFAEPLPLVVEIWSRTTGSYDIAAKLPAYQARGDLEIWYFPLPPPSPHPGEGSVHPYERTLTTWRGQTDGSYTEETYRGGIVPVASLPGVSIDLDALLDG